MHLESELAGSLKLRTRLYEVLEDLKDGKVTPEVAAANARLAHAIIETIKNTVMLEALQQMEISQQNQRKK